MVYINNFEFEYLKPYHGVQISYCIGSYNHLQIIVISFLKTRTLLVSF